MKVRRMKDKSSSKKIQVKRTQMLNIKFSDFLKFIFLLKIAQTNGNKKQSQWEKNTKLLKNKTEQAKLNDQHTPRQ